MTTLKRLFVGETALEVAYKELRKYVSRETARLIIDTKIGWAHKA